MYTKKPHPFRKTAWYLEFLTGHTWSCVNLGSWDYVREESRTPFDEQILEGVGKMYDAMGGRYEAMMITKDGIDGDHQVRAHSWEELFEKVEQYEKDNFTH